VREQAAFAVGNLTFRHADAASTIEHPTLGPDTARLWRDGSTSEILNSSVVLPNPFSSSV